MWLWLLLACGPEANPRPPQGAAARMDFTRAEGLYGAPFPSQDLVRDDGTVDLSAYPDPTGNAYVASVLASLQRARGFGVTSGIFLAFDEAIAIDPIGPEATLAADAPVWLAPIDDLDARVPLDVVVQEDPGPYGAPWLLSALPVQGVPLRAGVPHVLVVRTDLHPDLVPADAVRSLIGGGEPPGLTGEALRQYRAALAAVLEAGHEPTSIAAVAVFTPGEPVAAFRRAVHAARGDTPTASALELTEVYPEFCVFEGTVDQPVYQDGEPPYATDGGGWVLDDDGLLVRQRTETARLWVTLPRGGGPDLSAAVMIRTGGGGDNPLVHRGVRAEPGGQAVEPGTGPARDRRSWAGLG